jgi:hypothetical protein
LRQFFREKLQVGVDLGDPFSLGRRDPRLHGMSLATVIFVTDVTQSGEFRFQATNNLARPVKAPVDDEQFTLRENGQNPADTGLNTSFFIETRNEN